MVLLAGPLLTRQQGPVVGVNNRVGERAVSKKRGKSLRSIMVREVQQRLTEVFLEKGFSPVPLRPEELNSEMKTAFPLGRLKRKRGNKLDVVEFQFDKYRRPRFVINFGIVPEEGITYPWGVNVEQDVARLVPDVHVEQDVATPVWPDDYRLYSSTFRMRWFKLGLLSAKNEKAISRLVDKAIALSGEINNWFESGTVGKHMRQSPPLPTMQQIRDAGGMTEAPP